jgi:DNA-binding MarR family transcriptional regulator
MEPKAKSARPAPTLTEHDFWPMMVKFVVSQKAWLISVCASFDLTPMQGHALRMLDPAHPVPMGTLADVLACDASNVTGIVDKLESRGLIARQADAHDRRIKVLAVTERGRVLRERLSARMMEPPKVVATMPAAARRRLAEVLHAVVEERDQERDEPEPAAARVGLKRRA